MSLGHCNGGGLFAPMADGKVWIEMGAWLWMEG